VLRATIDSLKTQLEKMEETQAANNSDVDNVRKEFSDRISAKEKKLQAVSRVSRKKKSEWPAHGLKLTVTN
jgi:hypothetical protein